MSALSADSERFFGLNTADRWWMMKMKTEMYVLLA